MNKNLITSRSQRAINNNWLAIQVFISSLHLNTTALMDFCVSRTKARHSFIAQTWYLDVFGWSQDLIVGIENVKYSNKPLILNSTSIIKITIQMSFSRSKQERRERLSLFYIVLKITETEKCYKWNYRPHLTSAQDWSIITSSFDHLQRSSGELLLVKASQVFINQSYHWDLE